MNDEQLKELREKSYGLSVGNLNPDDVVDYMAIASACARMESRRAVHRMGCIGVDQSKPNPGVHPSPDASAGVGGATRCSRFK